MSAQPQDAMKSHSAEEAAVHTSRPHLPEMPDPLTQAAPASPVLLQAQELTVNALLGRQGASEVLRSLDFELRRGRTLGLVGESGAGKSMIGRVIARQLPPGFQVAQGRLDFLGQDVLKLPPAAHRALLGQRIAFIPQEPMTALNPVRRVGDQFAEHLRRLGVAKDECAARAADALAEVLLPRPGQLLERYPFELSGGMCQRVMIAMAFAGNPDLVISDEATTALDVSTQAHVVALLRQMQERRGTSVIFVTHDLGLATHACDDAVVLYAGDIVERGAAKTVLSRPAHPYTRALQQAIPALQGPRHALTTLPGQMPGVSRFPELAGCRFAPRCSQAQADCHAQWPKLHNAPASAPAGSSALMSDVGTPHQLRCWHPIAPVHASTPDSNGVANHPVSEPAPEPGRAMSAKPILELRAVGKTYRHRRHWFAPAVETQALHPLELSVAPGEFVGIVGESGSGKSTLARLIMGLEAPTSGSMHLNGQALGQHPREWQRRISAIQMIFQNARAALNPDRHIGSLLTQSMEARPHLRSDRATRALTLASDVGLAADTVSRRPSQLSGGQRQRVNIGRALCDLPQILVADEIVSGLDVSIQAQVLNLLLTLRREHKIALLLISHDLGVVRHLCSRVLVMHRGQVVESGDTEQVLGHPQHPYTRALVAAVPPTHPQAHWPPTQSTPAPASVDAPPSTQSLT